jgi:hypothetical protein
MPGYAPLFGDNATNVPVNTTPLTNRLVTNELLVETVGAAAGAAALATKSRVKHPTTPNQEVKPVIESESLINRNTTAADLTAVETKFTKKKPSFAFVRDLSGNGGPAFTRS